MLFELTGRVKLYGCSQLLSNEKKYKSATQEKNDSSKIAWTIIAFFHLSLPDFRSPFCMKLAFLICTFISMCAKAITLRLN